jgi:DUF1365 family protein
VIAGIHWQALKLWAKRVPVFRHVQKTGAHPVQQDGASTAAVAATEGNLTR